MRILFIRHGHPNYQEDCLTPMGHEHAKKAALRLKDEGIDQIYASSCGRAYETALHTAELLEKPVTRLDFLREICWGSLNGEPIPENGHPWKIAHYAVSQGFSLMDKAWTRQEPFANNCVFDSVAKVQKGADAFLEQLGYRREGENYRVIGDCTQQTVALFSHAGSSSAFLSHILNLPFFYVCGTLEPGFTAITAVTLSDTPGALTSPSIEYANDARHISCDSQSPQM